MRRPFCNNASIPARVEPVAVRSSMSSAVGPNITLPNTVGATSTPLVSAVGTGRMVRPSSGRASLSNTMSSPRRGRTVKPSNPKRRWSSSPYSPAALTTNRVRTSSPSPVRSTVSSAPTSHSVT